MISLNKISINFTGDFLFKDLSFVAGDIDKIGLVGNNGAGKSTLLKIIHGILSPENGDIIITSGFKTGYLPQEMFEIYATTVKEEAMKAFSEQLILSRKIKSITEELNSNSGLSSERCIQLAQHLSDLTTKFQHLGGYSIEGDTEKVLLGLGFKHSDFQKPLKDFSSGWQMRVNLAKILLQSPEIILLDEPTNHLDIESIQWLEDYLANYTGCLILVSHDRTFLDRVTNRTIEITLGNIQDYKCSYSQYVNTRLERIEIQKNAFTNQQKEIANIERFIERFRYKSSKAKQVQSKIKLLDKIDKIEIEQLDKSSIFFRFPPSPHSGKITLEAENLILGYDNKTVLEKLNLRLERGEKVAFVGRNGEGKSTLVKSIVGELKPKKGHIKLGHNVVLGYYAQNQTLLLDPKKTVFQTIDEIAIGEVRTKIRSILGSFLFSTEDTEKKVKVLSGGEKSRLAIAKLLISPFNLLILDEPTNHLDMRSKDVLKNALLQYEGSMILVSHDRDFLQGLTEKVIEFKNKNIKTYTGDVFDFLDHKKINSFNEIQKKKMKNKEPADTISPHKQNWTQKKEEEAKKRKIQNKIKKLEKDIENLNISLQNIEDKLKSPENITSNSLYVEYENCKDNILSLEEEWLKLHME